MQASKPDGFGLFLTLGLCLKRKWLVLKFLCSEKFYEGGYLAKLGRLSLK